MSKGNLFLGYARGKVGDVVFTHQYGEQITRARNRSPKNPKSPLQTLQRICFNTASKAYSYLQDICNHSFEGYQEGTPCQAEFIRRNISMLRDKLAYPIAYPEDWVMRDSDAWNFNQQGDALPVANEWIVSNGSIMSTRILASATSLYGLVVPYAALSSESTYADIVRGLKCERGDQLTFLVATYNTSSTNPYLRSLLTGFSYARIILEPSDGDMTRAFLTGSGDNWAVSAPNASNEGVVTFGAISQSSTHTLPINAINSIVKQGDDAQAALYPVLGCVIISRNVGGRWLRSSQSLTWTRPGANVLQDDTFKLAYLSYQDASGSTLYLNQAE